jgi:HSP20 family protein
MNQIVRPAERRFGWDLFGDFDGLVNQVLRPANNSNIERAANVAIDVKETEDAYTVHAELPGVKKQDLDISINEGVLTINAETRFEHAENQDGRVLRQERRYGKYVRSMRLGNDVDDSAVTADYSDGILTLKLPKTEQVKPKKVEVKVN